MLVQEGTELHVASKVTTVLLTDDLETNEVQQTTNAVPARSGAQEI